MDARAEAREGVRSSEFIGDDLSLMLNNSLDAIEEGQRELERFSDRHALDAGVRNRLEVIFEELVSNVIRHGFAPLADQSIRVYARAKPTEIEIIFEDDGSPFDPLSQAPPEPFRTLEDAKLGGLGIPLVLRLSSSMRHERPIVDHDLPAFRPINRLVVTLSRTG